MKATPKVKEAKRFPRCPECGGNVELCAKSGRTREHRRGVEMDIPADFGIPTCVKCGEEMLSAKISERLEAILQEQYLKQQADQLRACIQILKVRHQVTQQEIEDACGVTRSYLSHLVSGKREASSTLMRLVESFVISGDAFGHARECVQLNLAEQIRAVFQLKQVPQKYCGENQKRGTYRNPVQFLEREHSPSLPS